MPLPDLDDITREARIALQKHDFGVPVEVVVGGQSNQEMQLVLRCTAKNRKKTKEFDIRISEVGDY